ncbi:DUF397 domain-containing protein [Streptomyces deccanensis]|uniref:DUF397 domain-containing protein n=1 Tax=Streptomyces deccanensis TaxID=424188 RepID=UPI001EFAAE0F|nr:DUF397 domain-containing protein [Streptomyces deccanensis]ULR50929.1 DUF397 domain-containing protein [Streptomyces deccanensis]
MPVPPPAPARAWFKSSYSGANATECLEAAIVPAGVLIRDSNRPDFAHLTVSTKAWVRFVAAAMK